jgi:hypothetical protein
MGGDFQTYLDMLPDYSKTLQSAMENALSVADYEDRFNSIGEGIKQTLEKRMNEVSFAKLQQNFINANDTMIALMSGSEVSMDNMMQLTQDMKSYTAQAEQSAYRTRAMLDMLSMDTNVDYSASNTQVEYQTGSTNNNTYNFNITNETTIGNFLGDSRAIQQFTDSTFGNIVESAKKFGYEIKKK